MVSFLDRFGYQLSGGERRRCEVARALAVGRLGPKFLLLDEPFAGVDPIAINDLQILIRKLKNKNIGILITDHNVRATLAITSRAYILNQGKILAYGSSEQLTKNQVVKEHYPDQTDKTGKFVVTDVKTKTKLNKPVTLEEIKNNSK